MKRLVYLYRSVSRYLLFHLLGVRTSRPRVSSFRNRPRSLSLVPEMIFPGQFRPSIVRVNRLAVFLWNLLHVLVVMSL